MTYPRSRNGWTDDGTTIRVSNTQLCCPNCGSNSFKQTVSLEKCDSCGLQMDYWGQGGNSVYEAYLERDHARLQAAEEARQREQACEWQSCHDHDD